MGQNRACTLLITVMAFCLGVILSKCLHFGLSYSNTISLADIANILITSVVTIFAAWYLSKKLNEDRFSKELAISDLKEIEGCVSDIINKVQVDDTTKEEFREDLLKFINHLHQLISRFDRTCNLERKQESKDRVSGSFNNLFRYATDFSDDPLDAQSVIKHGTDLIVEIRNTISSINKL